MNIYVAGASKEVDEIVKFLAALRAAGHTVTYDWTTEVIYNRNRGGTDADVSSLDRLKYARLDAEGVLAADTLWLVVPEPGSTSNGSWVELGIAIGTYGQSETEKRIVVSGDWKRSIFTEFADDRLRYDSHSKALLMLCAEKP